MPPVFAVELDLAQADSSLLCQLLQGVKRIKSRVGRLEYGIHTTGLQDALQRIGHQIVCMAAGKCLRFTMVQQRGECAQRLAEVASVGALAQLQLLHFIFASIQNDSCLR